MPEIGEVARIVHYLKKHLVGKTIAAVKTQEDDIVYGKVGCSASAFQKAMTGKKVIDARQQGRVSHSVASKDSDLSDPNQSKYHLIIHL
ncbi:uncharacterized protein K441DRAFT_655624 [Cenococcum geophilum 1.58]|uniref:uncharacterized protein n=1 Tax=Cenococcum geophilum 1.58 TaxID=794803 RepID=UPI00358F4615|nr:hypothetical protein K441DRAFT_655624 [Cenococcum geophilum 1.58]